MTKESKPDQIEDADLDAAAGGGYVLNAKDTLVTSYSTGGDTSARSRGHGVKVVFDGPSDEPKG